MQSKDEKIGLFFGSFNPPSLSHLKIGRAAIERRMVDKVYYILSPHNPFKNSATLLTSVERFRMLKMMLLASNSETQTETLFPLGVEFNLRRPNYTCDTLKHLIAHNNIDPSNTSIIVGMDVFNSLGSWREFEWIIDTFSFIVARRKSASFGRSDAFKRVINLKREGKIERFNEKIKVLVNWSDKNDYSSTEIRNCLKWGVPVNAMVHPVVANYLYSKKFYQDKL